MDILLGISWVTWFLVVWFRTEATLEYAKLFRLNKWFKLEDWELAKTPGYSYQDFLLEYHNNFFTRLVCCPICVSTWLGLFVSIFVGIVHLPVLSLLGLSLYKQVTKIL